MFIYNLILEKPGDDHEGVDRLGLNNTVHIYNQTKLRLEIFSVWIKTDKTDLICSSDFSQYISSKILCISLFAGRVRGWG